MGFILLMSVSAHITRLNKKFIIGFEFIKFPYNVILCTIIYMLAYILYFTLESKMIIVGLHIITSRHVFNIHQLPKYAYVEVHPSKHDTANSGSTLKGFEFQKFSQTIELTLWQFTCDCTPAVLPHCSSQRDAFKT